MLWGNYSVLNKGPGRWLGGNGTAHASGVGTAQVNTRANWGKTGALRNFAITEYSTDAYELASIPGGYGARGWLMPLSAGGISAHATANGLAGWSGSIAAGRNIAATFAGAATYTGTGQLVVSGVGAFSGSATWAGNVTAALNATGSFAGVASWSGSVVAKGNIAAAFAGVASFTAVRYASGSLSGTFAPPVTLEAQGFSTYLLDEEDVETGLTLRQALRLVTAATAGKISGGGSTTITIRNAVADGVDRIVATVTADGDRTAISYNLE